MRWKTWAIAAGVPCAALGACTVGDVRASGFDRSCAKDDDCMLVFEVVANGTACTQPCGAINKSDVDKYNAKVDDKLHDCDSVAQGSCRGTAICNVGTCVFAGPRDAGTD